MFSQFLQIKRDHYSVKCSVEFSVTLFVMDHLKYFPFQDPQNTESISVIDLVFIVN